MNEDGSCPEAVEGRRLTFTFNHNGTGRQPATIAGPIVYVLPASRDRIKEALERGCYCQHDGARTATLTRRNGAAWLQCDACGSALGSAMRKDEHPKILQYPAWRIDLVDRYEEARRIHNESVRQVLHQSYASYEQEKLARAEEYRTRAAEYEIWCRASPEWANIKKLIYWRSRGHCEACLEASAEVVHHLTYEFGKLPPAWHLKAVCSSCHERLHCPGDDWCDYGMARGA